MNSDLKEELKNFIDKLETDIGGELEGFEVKLSHKLTDGKRDAYATIDEFVIYYLHKETIDI